MIRLVALAAIAAATTARKAAANELITNQGAGLQLIATFDRLPIDFALTDSSQPFAAELPAPTGTADDSRALA